MCVCVVCVFVCVCVCVCVCACVQAIPTVGLSLILAPRRTFAQVCHHPLPPHTHQIKNKRNIRLFVCTILERNFRLFDCTILERNFRPITDLYCWCLIYYTFAQYCHRCLIAHARKTHTHTHIHTYTHRMRTPVERCRKRMEKYSVRNPSS